MELEPPNPAICSAQRKVQLVVALLEYAKDRPPWAIGEAVNKLTQFGRADRGTRDHLIPDDRERAATTPVGVAIGAEEPASMG